MLRFITIATFLAVCFTQNARADLYNQQIGHGTQNGVSFSWLTTGTNNHGGGASNLWAFSGNLVVDYQNDGTTQSVSLFGGPTVLDIHSGGSSSPLMGTLTIRQLELSDNLGDGFANDLIGYMVVDVAGSGLNDLSNFRVYFLDRSYNNTNNTPVFNGFDVANGLLELRLWGNETVDGGQPANGENYGLDWMSSGGSVIPAPNASMLGLLGMACIAVARRRVL